MSKISVFDAAARLGVPAKRFLTIPEAAPALGLAPGTLYQMSRKKSDRKAPVPFRRVGRRVLVDIYEVFRWAEDGAHG